MLWILLLLVILVLLWIVGFAVRGPSGGRRRYSHSRR
jgi:hypothetical protein